MHGQRSHVASACCMVLLGALACPSAFADKGIYVQRGKATRDLRIAGTDQIIKKDQSLVIQKQGRKTVRVGNQVFDSKTLGKRLRDGSVRERALATEQRIAFRE